MSQPVKGFAFFFPVWYDKKNGRHRPDDAGAGMIEWVNKDNLMEYEQFVLRHPQGGFLQSSLWGRQKPDWRWRAMLRRNQWGRITGSLSVLCRRAPVLPCAMVYGCRGPVCDPGDRETLEELLAALRRLAKKERAYLVRLDPAMPEGPWSETFGKMGFAVRRHRRRYQPAQPRHVWQVPLPRQADRVQDAFSPDHLQKIRIALKRGVEVRQGGRELVPAFAALMQQQGIREGRVVRPPEYFAGLMENFGPQARIFLAEMGGRCVAGALVLTYGAKATCVFAANDGDATLPARYLLRAAVLEQAALDGCTDCEFPGPFRSRRSVEYAFAAGFGGRMLSYLGELDLVMRPIANLLSDLFGTLSARIHRWIYFFRVR